MQNEPASNAIITVVNGKDLKELAWSPHNRKGSGLLEMAWKDPRGQAAADGWGGLTQLYQPATCFCSPIHTEKYLYHWNGEYLDLDTDEPIGDLEGEEISINSNNYCDPSKLLGKNVADMGDYSINLPFSDNQLQNPTMSSNPGNNSQAAGANGVNGDVLPIDNNRRENAETMEEDNVLPIIGSKSLVTAKKGFTPFFKSIACRELPQHCSHPSCFSKALTLTESYEAVTLCRVIALL